MPDEVNNILPPDGTLPAIAEADPELAAEVEKAKEDRRAKTSAENGKSGGRPHIEVDQWARDFVEQYHTENGITTLRYHAGEWYEYRNGRYVALNKNDLESELVGALQRAKIGARDRLSKALISDIVLNLKADAICGLHSGKYHIPCFISSRKTAKGLMPMRNTVIDIEALARAVIEGTPLQYVKHIGKTPDLFITYGLDYDFDPGARCPKFRRYLEEVQPNPENQSVLQMLMGLALVPDCSYNVAFFLYGQGGTGKSVFVNVLSALVGAGNCCSVPLANLADRFGKAPLTEKLLNLVGELPVMPENGRSADIEGFFKMITSGDEIPVERKGIDGWTAPAIARMVFATNTMPVFTDRSNGVWDRIRIIPFQQVFRNTERQNPNLSAELLEERPGILNFAIEGLAMLRKLRTFPECQEGLKIREELRSDCDHERTFLQETTEEAPGSFVSSDLLFKKYKDWMLNSGYRPVGIANFRRAITRLYPRSHSGRKQTQDGKKEMFFDIRTLQDW